MKTLQNLHFELFERFENFVHNSSGDMQPRHYQQVTYHDCGRSLGDQFQDTTSRMTNDLIKNAILINFSLQ